MLPRKSAIKRREVEYIIEGSLHQTPRRKVKVFVCADADSVWVALQRGHGKPLEMAPALARGLAKILRDAADKADHTSVVWIEGDRVEIHGVPRWEGHRGRITTQYPPSQLDPSWVAVAIDDQDGVFVFKDDELTRIEG